MREQGRYEACGNRTKLVREEGEPCGNGELYGKEKLRGEWEAHWEGAQYRKREKHGEGEYM